MSGSEKSLLCKGLKFALPPKKIDYADFLLQFELLYHDTLEFNLPSEKRDLLKSKLKDICFSTLNSYNFDKVNTNLTESESKSLKELIGRKDLVIQKAEKGSTVVITDRESYLKGIKSLLSDNMKFMPLNIDQNKWLKKLKEHFKTLEKDNKISEDEFKSICPIGTRPGILYGQPKVHKTVINSIPQFRPILSAINIPVYKLAKYLVPILSPLTVNDYTVKDSFTLAKEVINFDHNLFMASLDVESLFTNIPMDETIKNAVDDLFSSDIYRGKLSKSELYYLLKLATSESSFVFDNILYKQIDGVPMGSPLGSTLANAFLCHYEKLWLDSCPPEFKPVVYRRYVDDIFVFFKSKDHLLLFAKYMNTKHKQLKFTFDFEQNNSFSFLDVKITRGSKVFSTSVFRKATFSGVFTIFDRLIFESYKTGLIFTLLFCCFTICSDMQSFHLEVEQLRQIFKCNNYTVALIDQCVKTFLNKIYVPKRILITVLKQDVLTALPFLGQFSLNLRSRLYNIFNKTLPHCNIKVIFQSKNRLINLFRLKDSVPKELRSHIVYKFLCSNYNVTYYGETEHHLNVRSGERLSLSALTGKRVNNNKKSAVKDHCLFFNHVGSFEDFSILTYESHLFKVLIKEAL